MPIRGLRCHLAVSAVLLVVTSHQHAELVVTFEPPWHLGFCATNLINQHLTTTTYGREARAIVREAFTHLHGA
jgi:hypothetical protein